MKPTKLTWIGVLAGLGAWLGCNGIVVVDHGEPGSGGSAPTTSSSATGGGSASTTTSTTTGTGGAGGCTLEGVPEPFDCATACSALYDCGALPCDGMAACMFTGSTANKAGFVGDAMSGCIQGCTAQMALIGLVDTSDCATTISTLKGVSSDFAASCDNGISSPACISCSAALDDNVTDICAESIPLYEAWAACVCEDSCAPFCGDNLCIGNEETQECQECMLDTNGGCGEQLIACLDDT